MFAGTFQGSASIQFKMTYVMAEVQEGKAAKLDNFGRFYCNCVGLKVIIL